MSIMQKGIIWIALIHCFFAVQVKAGDASKPGSLTVDPPTLKCLGVKWMIQGDKNKNASISLEYRKVGTEEWKTAFPLQRAYDSPITEKKFQTKSGSRSYFHKVPGVKKGTWRFAGSAWNLEEGTEYELKVSLTDPDGGDTEKIVKSKTRTVPPRKGTEKELYAAPGDGGGSGSKDDPFKGVAAALKVAAPGDTVWLLPGTYKPFAIIKNGTPGKPIVIRGAPGGEAVIDGGNKEEGTGIGAQNKKWINLDSLTIKNVRTGIMAKGASNVTIRYCNLSHFRTGITMEDSSYGYVADNTVTGNLTWPRDKSRPGTNAIDIAGHGHTACFNRIFDSYDGLSCNRGGEKNVNYAMDFYNNEISECSDEGIESDYGDWNIRIFNNRLTNCYQGISSQPVRGGPSFVFRNVIYNICVETFKLHNYTSGQWLIHNTCIKNGVAMKTSMPKGMGIINVNMYNNLLVGSGDKGYAVNFGVDMIDCSMDYNGIAGGKFGQSIRWARKKMPPFSKLHGSGPIQEHGVFINTKEEKLFVDGFKMPTKCEEQYPLKQNDARLADGTPAIDAGKVMAGFNDGFKGKAPDLGAYEHGDELPHYGPRPQTKE